MAGECTLTLTLLKAWNLPKVDMLSKIDPYFKIKLLEQKLKSKKISDNDKPEYNESFTLTTKISPEGGPEGTVFLELWDQGTFKGDHIGTATFNLQDYNPVQLSYLELPIQLQGSLAKKKCNSTVAVAVTGVLASYASLRTVLASYFPGTLFNDMKHKAYVPLPNTNNAIYIGVEYEGPVVDVKVYTTVKDLPLFVDMVLPSRPKTKVLRRSYPAGTTLVQNLMAYEEVKLDDIKIAELPGVQILLFRRELLWQCSADEVVSAHGWKGKQTFKSACSSLVGIDMDVAEEEIFMQIEKSNREALMLVDWDDGDVDIKVGVLALPTTGSKAFDLSIKNKDVQKKSDLYAQPRVRCNGKYAFSRVLQLDDVPHGTAFEDITIYCSQLADPSVLPLLSLVPMVPIKRG